MTPSLGGCDVHAVQAQTSISYLLGKTVGKLKGNEAIRRAAGEEIEGNGYK